MRITAKVLCQRHKISAEHALYRNDGKWYHQLRRFPGALLDVEGYIIFFSEEEYRSCDHLRIAVDVHIRDGIRSIPGYVRFVDQEGRVSPPKKSARSAVNARGFEEGAVREVRLEIQDRNGRLKDAATCKLGFTCQICDFNFGEAYGEFAAGYIEVHHIRPLSSHKRSRFTRLKDVAVVCANCHRVLHLNGAEPMAIESLREKILAKRAQIVDV